MLKAKSVHEKHLWEALVYKTEEIAQSDVGWTLIHQQSSLGCFVLGRCVKTDEVVLLQKGISVELPQKNLQQLWILS